MRIMVAFRAFFAALFSPAAARSIRAALDAPDSLNADARSEPEKPTIPAAPPKPARSEAVTLLAALQRETRLVDLVQESLDQYSDDQVGAAARDVLRDCRGVLKRMFDLQPVVDDDEGAAVDISVDFDKGRFRLTGNVVGEPPFTGTLVHHGWLAAKCEVPTWTGDGASTLVVSPAEVEIA